MSYRVATRRHCLILLKNRSIKFRARYRYGLKQIGSFRFRFGGMFAHAPCWRASSLIQSASYPRSASKIVCGSKALRRTEHSQLSCAWRSNGRSVRVGIVPLFQVYPVFVPLFSLHRSFPGLIGLLGVLPVGILARILIWFLCSWNCSSKSRTQLFKHGARPQLNRGKVRMFNYGLARRAGKVHPLPGPC